MIYPTVEIAATSCAEFIADVLKTRLDAGPTASLAISGGSTPKLMFGTLTKCTLDWSRIHLFWVDERCVPPDDPQSNFRLANESLISVAGIPEANVHRIRGELPPVDAAAACAEDIRTFFGGDAPRFDVIHCGMGADSHTASLFPGEPLIEDRTGICAAVYVEKLKAYRITLLPGALASARQVVVLAAGADKAEAMRAVWEGPLNVLKHPAQILVRESIQARWFVDEAAATLVA